RVFEQRAGAVEVDLRVLEAPHVPEEPADATVRRASLRADVEAVGPNEHLAVAVESLVVSAEELEDVAEVEKRTRLLLRLPFRTVAEQSEPLRVLVRRLRVRVPLPREVSRIEVRRRRLNDEAGPLLVPGQHPHVLLVRADVRLEREPVGDRL